MLKYLHSGNQLKHSLTLKLQEHVVDVHQLALAAGLRIYCDWNGNKPFLVTRIMRIKQPLKQSKMCNAT